MILKILAVGDIVGLAAVEYLKNNMWKIRRMLGADAVIANGENACDVRGIGANEATALLDGGVDLITTGNHVWGRRDIYSVLDDDSRIIRPANYPAATPGCGHSIINVCGYRLLCINAQGTVYLDPLDNPFTAVEKILTAEEGRYDISLLDFHAEATSEKIAMAMNFDGRINIVFGTHTHVQTADERVMAHGTGYITDLGMTGPDNGILGSAPEPIIERFKTHMPQRFSVAEGETVLCGAVFELDTDSKRCLSVKRVRLAPSDVV
ncbi:MAG: TIGR00282 family metallophosphoesterase [Ruminococcaceae bacterium]|nr:TIGR00282 family metallophosphoesterase [Oscillospiraceae bacterium]